GPRSTRSASARTRDSGSAFGRAQGAGASHTPAWSRDQHNARSRRGATVTAWSRRVNAAAHRGVGEKAAPKPDLFAEATAAEVDADGMATLKTLIALARERPSFAVTVEVATAKSGAQAFKVAASESGPTVRKV